MIAESIVKLDAARICQIGVPRQRVNPAGHETWGIGYRASGSSSGRIQVTSGAWPGS